MATLTVSTPYAAGGVSDVRAAFNDNLKLVPFTFVPSTSYATSGDTIPAANMPTGIKDLVTPWAIGAPNGMGFQLDITNQKLLAFASSVTGGAQVTAATNLQTALGSAAITVFFLCR